MMEKLETSSNLKLGNLAVLLLVTPCVPDEVTSSLWSQFPLMETKVVGLVDVEGAYRASFPAL